MAENEPVRFVSSSIKVPPFQNPHPFPIFPNVPFARQTLASNLQKSGEAFLNLISSLSNLRKFHNLLPKPSLLRSASLSLARSEEPGPNPSEGRDSPQIGYLPHRHAREDEERVLISEVLIRNKDGEELERKDLEAEAAAALKACLPNSALTVREVQEDVLRIMDSGYFCSCMPVAIDTRDGIRLVFQVSC